MIKQVASMEYSGIEEIEPPKTLDSALLHRGYVILKKRVHYYFGRY